AFRPPAAGEPGQQARRGAPHRSMHERGIPLGADSESAYAHVEERASPWQHGGARQRAVHWLAHLRGRDRSEPADAWRWLTLALPHGSYLAGPSAIVLLRISSGDRR